jgi:glyoxylate reductase
MTRVCLTRHLPEPIMHRMGELFELVIPKTDDRPLTPGELLSLAADAEVLVPSLNDVITDEVMAAIPGLKLIANFGAGVDHIDLAAAAKRDIVITNTPSVLTEDTADVAMALIFATPRRLGEAAQEIRTSNWHGWSPLHLLGHRVNGKALGIVGLGRIGQAVARRAKGFGLSIHYHQRTRLHESVEKEFGAVFHPKLNEMLGQIDILSLHCPYTLETHHLIAAEQFALMKPTAYIVNTARGALIHEQALIHALQSGQVAGAGLDVYEHAPKIHADLRACANTVLLPHVSSATVESRIEMGEKVLINIRSFIDGNTPPDVVLAD